MSKDNTPPQDQARVSEDILNDAIEIATLKERLRAATVAREAARKALEQGFLNLIPDKVFDAVHEASGLPVPETGVDGGVARDATTELVRNAYELAAQVAERDVDWSAFGKRNIGQWEGGPDSARDYRIGIATGRAIAASIRALATTTGSAVPKNPQKTHHTERYDGID